MNVKGKVAVAVICSMLLLAGCSDGKNPPKAEVDISPIVSSQDNSKGNEGLVIGSVTMSSAGEWYGEVLAGVRTAASDLGITLIEQDSNGDVVAEEEQIRGFISDKVDAIIICPITSDKTGAILSEAEKAGIPVVTWNTTVDTDITAKVCVDSEALGGDTGDYLVEYIRTYNLSDLKIGMITNESYTIGVARCDGFREAVKTLEEDGSAVVVSEMLAETTEETTEAVGKMLAEYPDIDIIWCWNQTSLLACIDVVKGAGHSDLIITGTDMSMDLARDMQEDSVNLLAVTTQLPYNIGYKAVANAVQAAKGEKPDKTIMIPTFTYVKSDTDGVEQYIKSHEAFAQ